MRTVYDCRVRIYRLQFGFISFVIYILLHVLLKSIFQYCIYIVSMSVDNTNLENNNDWDLWRGNIYIFPCYKLPCVGITISLFTLYLYTLFTLYLFQTFALYRLSGRIGIFPYRKRESVIICNYEVSLYIEHNTVMVTRLVTWLRRTRFRFRWITFCFSFVPIYALSWVTFYQNQ